MNASLPATHREVCRRLGPRAAVRFVRDGVDHALSWNACRRAIDGAAAGLIELGIAPGDRVALFSPNRPEWLLADLAVLSAAAVDVPLHAPLTAEQAEYQLAHSAARGVIVGGAEQMQKLAAALPRLPGVEFVVCFDIRSRPPDGTWRAPARSPVPGASRSEDHSHAGSASEAACTNEMSLARTTSPPAGGTYLTWQELVHRGRAAGRAGEVRRREAALAPDDLATIIYTSGTTGPPKGVMLTHGNLLSNAAGTKTISRIGEDDLLSSWLPYSHIYARTVDLYVTMLAGATLAMSDSIDALVADLARFQPTWLTAVPRFYEKVWSGVEHLPAEDRRAALHKLFGPNIRQLSSGGAPLPRHVCEGFIEAGLLLLEGYGLTESSPVISFNAHDAWRIGTVGRPLPEVEVKIAEDGEILTKGPHVMRGYWKNPEATAEAVRDGWLHTGDVGRIDGDGFLAITDRKKDILVTSGGKNVAPAEVERLLVADEFIDQAVVYGDGRPFVSALIVPNLALLESRLEEIGGELAAEGDFLRGPAVYDFFAERIERAMQPLSRPERVRRFLLLSRPFRVEEGELTATLKLRRRHIIDRYEAELAGLYDSADAGYVECRSPNNE
ncbi:MAG: AMP-dependent synthetase/ligase [Planctomycetales bacterium]